MVVGINKVKREGRNVNFVTTKEGDTIKEEKRTL